MGKLFYVAARHGVVLRALFILAVMVATVLAVGSPEPVAAAPDCLGP